MSIQYELRDGKGTGPNGEKDSVTGTKAWIFVMVTLVDGRARL